MLQFLLRDLDESQSVERITAPAFLCTRRDLCRDAPGKSNQSVISENKA
jgi:hypothetical protein